MSLPVDVERMIDEAREIAIVEIKGVLNLQERPMHYRNGREAKNGDVVVQLNDGKVVAAGVLWGAKPGNDYCNGSLAPIQNPVSTACLCDCLHIDDVAALLAEKGLDKRPAGK